jgi:hypothetical protein
MSELDILETAEKMQALDPINWIQTFRDFATKERIRPLIRDRIIVRLTQHNCEASGCMSRPHAQDGK